MKESNVVELFPIQKKKNPEADELLKQFCDIYLIDDDVEQLKAFRKLKELIFYYVFLQTN